MRGLADPAVSFLVVLVIGAVAGLLFDRVAGPGWLTRQVAGSRRAILTSMLVGIAGAFIGFHLALLLQLGAGLGAFVGAAVGAGLVLLVWHRLR